MLKKAGISPTEWERFVKNTSDYNALVRAWNAQIARQALKALDGPRTATGSGLNTVDRAGVSTDTPATIARPPELRDAVQQFLEPNAPAKKSGARK
jgi:hypothetical protein